MVFSGRAEMLAGTTADAFGLVHCRNLYSPVRAFIIHHENGTRRAVARTITATDTFGQDHTILFDEHGMADMNVCLFLTVDVPDGSSGADFAATCTFRTAVTALEGHDGLHEVHQVGGGTQYIIGTR